MRVTASRAAVDAQVEAVVPRVEESALVPFRLVLSAPAASVTLDTGGVAPTVSPDQLPIIGKLVLDPQNPRISLVVHWKNPPTAGEHRFAKLTLEAPGQATVSHVFDAAGDIDDFLELPFSTAK